jgi:hypothetical protein
MPPTGWGVLVALKRLSGEHFARQSLQSAYEASFSQKCEI